MTLLFDVALILYFVMLIGLVLIVCAVVTDLFWR